MESKCSESADGDETFWYQPLANPGSSIRLIEIDPDTASDGTVQLHLFESTFLEEYTCLSYVWGQEHDGGGPFRILVNGKTFNVRCNLNNFLCVARRKYAKRRLWIDAICIDQANTPERNHQVQQMGNIYSRAKEVIAWLGHNCLAAEIIPRIDSRARHTARHLPADIWFYLWLFMSTVRPDCWGLCGNPSGKRNKRSTALKEAVRGYWARAWVTQEIALAKRVRLLVHDTEFDLTALDSARMRNFRPTFRALGELYATNTRHYKSQDQHLVELLNNYAWKECAIERDRVFSLLSLCVEGADIKVDYGLSDEKLLSTVLRASRLNSCLCSAHVVSRSINTNAISSRGRGAPYFVNITVQAADVYSYAATQRKGRPCCPNFQSKAFSESSDGHLFCLSNVCSRMKWHIFVSSQQLEKKPVKAIMRSNETTDLCLGENGGLVDIHGSPSGHSYTIKFDIKVLLRLSTGHNPILGAWWRFIGYTEDLDWPELCEVAQQTGGSSSVEFLDLGS